MINFNFYLIGGKMQICEKCKEEVKYYYCLKLCCKDCEDDYFCPHSCHLKREDEEQIK